MRVLDSAAGRRRHRRRPRDRQGGHAGARVARRRRRHRRPPAARLLAAAAAEITAELGGEVVPVPADTTDTASVRQLVEHSRAPRWAASTSSSTAPPPPPAWSATTWRRPTRRRCSPTSTPRSSATSAASRPSRRTCAERSYGRIVNIGGLTGRSSHALSGHAQPRRRPHDQGALRPARARPASPSTPCTRAWSRPSTSTSCTRRKRPRDGTTPAAGRADFVARTPIRRVLAAERGRRTDLLPRLAPGPAASPESRSASTAA